MNYTLEFWNVRYGYQTNFFTDVEPDSSFWKKCEYTIDTGTYNLATALAMDVWNPDEEGVVLGFTVGSWPCFPADMCSPDYESYGEYSSTTAIPASTDKQLRWDANDPTQIYYIWLFFL